MNSVWVTANDVYETLGQAIRDVVEGPAVDEAALNIDSIIGISISEPEASIRISLIAGLKEVSVNDGTTGCDVVLRGAGEAVASFFAGDGNLFLSLQASELTLSGPKSEVLVRLVPTIQRVITPLFIDNLVAEGLRQPLPTSEGPSLPVYSNSHTEPRYGGAQ